jgi:tRNA (guanine26-N2/guanine27-N2)-dimethyltransferase
MKKVKEGAVEIWVPEEEVKPSKSEAFYNPRMELNRDLSVAVALAYFNGEHADICEPLAATGIRGVRYCRELPNSEAWIGDIRESAVKLIEKNVKHNGCKNTHVAHKDANELLSEREYDFVDIDPFGTPSPFLDAALDNTKIGGLLALTATDMMALCGKVKGPMKKYDNAVSIRTEYCHETAVRLVIGLAARRAVKFGKGVKVLLSLSTDHYVRVFLEMTEKSSKGIGYVWHCNSCGNRGFVKTDENKSCKCGGKLLIMGPLWTGPLFEKDFLSKLQIEENFGTAKKLEKILGLMVEESDAPGLYFNYHNLCKRFKVCAPRLEDILNKLQEKGFTATKTHFDPTSFRTDAKVEEIKDIIES